MAHALPSSAWDIPTRRTTPAFHVVDFVLAQFLRAAGDRRVELTAYCFMPDHVHLLIHGQTDDSDCKSFIKLVKQ
jgi:REP element-mobilizing transposase RayT